jgi:crotonobetainyl-CoA:carnitine CoA-transferase CaiB-like acyl-CoA transferase
MPKTSDRLLPLTDFTVVEAGSLIAASYCGQLLADFGATVIKVEAPAGRAVDSLRQWGVHYKDGEGFLASILNRNKRLITLDISNPEGAKLFDGLLRHADVLIENFKPGTLATWGFDEENLKSINERLIHVAISGFGQSGPMAEQTAFGAIAEAMGGLRALTGFPGQPPVRAGVSIGDFLAGLYGAFGTALALIERSKSSKGQMIDVAIYEAVLGVIEDLLPTYQFFDKVRGPVGTGFDRFAPSNIYATRDGGWVLIAAPTDNTFKKLARCLGNPQLVDDPRFKSQSSRADHKSDIDAVVTAWTSSHDADEIVQLLRAANIPSGKTYTAADIMTDPHIKARQMVVFAPDERVGTVPMQGVVPKFSRTAGRIVSAGGRVGRDTDDVYRSVLGLKDEQLAALRKSGVI